MNRRTHDSASGTARQTHLSRYVVPLIGEVGKKNRVRSGSAVPLWPARKRVLQGAGSFCVNAPETMCQGVSSSGWRNRMRIGGQCRTRTCDLLGVSETL